MGTVNFTAPPTVAEFMRSDSFGRLIAGPVGSGKTTGCLFELFRRACEQHPAPDGLRYTRYAITRQTLKQLKDTVLKDITDWLSGVSHYKVSDNTIYVEAGDVRSEWLLIPLEDAEDQRRLLSMQLTGAWMSEAIEMDIGIIAPLSGRCGRYPGPSLGGATWKGVIADTNMPSEGSDWHKFMTEMWPDWQVFIQPGGMTPEAENLPYLNQSPSTLVLPVDHPVRIAAGRGYYTRLSRNPQDWVKRYVDAKYGDDPSGTAVHRESFKSNFHVVDNLEPVPGHLVMVGQDFGRDPWSIIGQIDHKGRLLVLKEVSAEDIGLELHVQKSLRPALMTSEFFGKPVALIGDPAGIAKDSIYEENSFDVLKRMGFMAFPAPSNDPDTRIRAVDAWLARQFDGGPAIIFSRKGCPTLVRAMNGGYRYAKTKSGQRKPKPDKNQYSHPSDALQYLAMAALGQMSELVGRHLARKRRPANAARVSSAGWT